MITGRTDSPMYRLLPVTLITGLLGSIPSCAISPQELHVDEFMKIAEMGPESLRGSRYLGIEHGKARIIYYELNLSSKGCTYWRYTVPVDLLDADQLTRLEAITELQADWPEISPDQ